MNPSTSWIQKRPGVCGGDACVRDTRYTVWGLMESRKSGLSDEEILALHPDITTTDLHAAWDYACQNPTEIERALWFNEACMVDHDGVHVPAALLQRGKELGLTDREIREAFEPVIDQAVLEAVWRDADRTKAIRA